MRLALIVPWLAPDFFLCNAASIFHRPKQRGLHRDLFGSAFAGNQTWKAYLRREVQNRTTQDDAEILLAAKTDNPLPCLNLNIQYGDRFIQIGQWRLGDVDGVHASIAHRDGATAQIFRSDGTLHPGPRADFTTWARPVGEASGISFGERFIQFGQWRLGDVDGGHASIAHTGGKTAQIYRDDGTLHPGPRTDYTTWARPEGDASGISFGDRFIQIGQWRFGDVDGGHASIAHTGGKTAQIYRKDGTLHPGPRADFTTWARAEEACKVPTPPPTPRPTPRPTPTPTDEPTGEPTPEPTNQSVDGENKESHAHDGIIVAAKRVMLLSTFVQILV